MGGSARRFCSQMARHPHEALVKLTRSTSPLLGDYSSRASVERYIWVRQSASPTADQLPPFQMGG